MKRIQHRFVAACAAALLPSLLALAPTPARATEEEPTAEEVGEARRCAATTRAAGHAFGEVRDSFRQGESSRAPMLLSLAEDTLKDARAACLANAEVTEQLRLLAEEVQGLRRALGTPRR